MHSPPHRSHDLRHGAELMVGSSLLFAAMSVAVKVAAAQLPNAQVVFLRNGLGLVALVPWLYRHGVRGLATRRLGDHLVRGIAGLLAMYCFFFTLGHLPLADAILLNYSLPLFMPFIERVWLKEPLPRRLGPPLLLGFVGVMLVVRPGFGVFRPVALVGVAAALFGAVAQVGIRRLTATEPATRIVFYFSWIATLGSAAPGLWAWQAPDLRLWLVLAAMGVLASVAQILLSSAYAQAPAGQVGPFVYSSVIFAAALDFAFWNRLPDAYTVVGAALVVAAGALTLRRLGGVRPGTTPPR